MTFLRYQFIMMVQDSSRSSTPMDVRGGKSPTRSPMHGRPRTPQSEVSTRPSTREHFPRAGSPTNSRPGSRPPTAPGVQPQSRTRGVSPNSATAGVANNFGFLGNLRAQPNLRHNPSVSGSGPLGMGFAPDDGATAVVLSPEEMPPNTSSYVSCRNRLLAKYSDLFTRIDQGRAIEDLPPTPMGTLLDEPLRALELCSACQKRRNRRGIGDVFCHNCSGVDNGNLSN